MPRRASRDAGPAVIDTDDTPSREELIEALGNLRAKSEAEYVEWRRLVGLNYIGAAKDAEAKWKSTNFHIDEMLSGIQFVDAINSMAS